MIATPWASVGRSACDPLLTFSPQLMRLRSNPGSAGDPLPCRRYTHTHSVSTADKETVSECTLSSNAFAERKSLVFAE